MHKGREIDGIDFKCFLKKVYCADNLWSDASIHKYICSHLLWNEKVRFVGTIQQLAWDSFNNAKHFLYRLRVWRKQHQTTK